MHHDCKIHNVEQGTPEWHELRNGLITASEVKLILTPTLKPADNDKSRAHLYELAAQRISGYTEETYIGDEMLRGQADEILARDEYSNAYEPVEEIGFITRDIGGATVGYSPDAVGVMGGFGLEIKSRRQKFQIQAIVDNEVPKEHTLQVQTGLFVTGWDYMDYVQRCAGLPLWVIRSEPIPAYQDAIRDAVLNAEDKITDLIKTYRKRMANAPVIIETEREEEINTEIFL